MSEIEKQAKTEIKKKINQNKILLNNIDKLLPFKAKAKKEEFRKQINEELKIWKFIFKKL